jgi:hypothetical protein
MINAEREVQKKVDQGLDKIKEIKEKRAQLASEQEDDIVDT